MSEQVHSPRRRLFGDDGFMLVEVLVSAIILVTVSLAVFSTLSQADGQAGTQQRRTLASDLAQSELEHVRSLPVEDIPAYQGDHSSDYHNIKNFWTTNVVAKWVSDSGDEAECTSQQAGLDYMRITTTVSWKNMGNAKPVSLTSLYTPTAGSGGNTGSISVYVTDRDGLAVSGVAVHANGETVGTDNSGITNNNGCIVFAYLPEDKYDVDIQRNGYVDGDSVPHPYDNGESVVAGQTTKLQYDYDSGGTTSVLFKTRLPTGQDAPTFPQHFQIFNAAQPSGPLDVDLGQAASTGAQSWDARNSPVTLLFPYGSPYTIYGGCKTNAIPASSPDATFVNIPKGAYQNAGTVHLPAMYINVYESGTALLPGPPAVGAIVNFDSGCGVWKRTAVAAGASIYTALGSVTGGSPTLALKSASPADPGWPYTTAGRVSVYYPKTGKCSAVWYGLKNIDLSGTASTTDSVNIIMPDGPKPGFSTAAPTPVGTTCLS